MRSGGTLGWFRMLHSTFCIGTVRPFLTDGGSDGGALGQPVEMVVDGDVEVREDGKVPVDGVGVKGFAWDGDVVEAAGAFADFVESDEFLAAGEPGEDGAAGKALEVDDEVEFLRAEPADAAEHFGPVLWLGPAFAFEADDAGEVWVAFKERGEPGIDPPVDLGVGTAEFQQTQDGQRLDDVAERTGFEDEDFQMTNDPPPLCFGEASE